MIRTRAYGHPLWDKERAALTGIAEDAIKVALKKLERKGVTTIELDMNSRSATDYWTFLFQVRGNLTVWDVKIGIWHSVDWTGQLLQEAIEEAIIEDGIAISPLAA